MRDRRKGPRVKRLCIGALQEEVERAGRSSVVHDAFAQSSPIIVRQATIQHHFEPTILQTAHPMWLCTEDAESEKQRFRCALEPPENLFEAKGCKEIASPKNITCMLSRLLACSPHFWAIRLPRRQHKYSFVFSTITEKHLCPQEGGIPSSRKKYRVF